MPIYTVKSVKIYNGQKNVTDMSVATVTYQVWLWPPVSNNKCLSVRKMPLSLWIGLFLPLCSGTFSSRNENLRPLLNRNIPLISGKYGLRNHFWPLKSGFLMRKSEKKGLNFLRRYGLILRLTFSELFWFFGFYEIFRIFGSFCDLTSLQDPRNIVINEKW